MIASIDDRRVLSLAAPARAGETATRSKPPPPLAADRVVRASLVDATLDAFRTSARACGDRGEDGGPVVLKATASQAAAIARGEHQIHVVDGRVLAEPSQRLDAIESIAPFERGQTHVTVKHEAQTLDSDIARLESEPHIPAAGGFRSTADAQYAVDETIANPANQRFLASFVADSDRSKDALLRVDLGHPVGDDVLRSDLDAGHAQLRPSDTATVVVIKDPSFPERYRVLTAYPEAQLAPQVDAAGTSR